ncbi:MAG TPA: TetR/AcrR family transcriptional regulator [Myxococcales bacterium]|nr:TetR/AcrR family transcriptional regulator [Myxococcales bacterium]
MTRRPLRADALRNREHLLGIARQVFASEGLDVPIDEIAKRAGLGIGTVYRHFPNKEALFEAIVVDQLERFVEETDALHKEADAERALLQFLDKYAAAGAAKKDFIEALGQAGPTPAIRKFFKRINESMGLLLSRAQKAGAIRKDVGVDEILVLLRGVLAAGADYAGPPEGRSRIWAVVLDGLRARKV